MHNLNAFAHDLFSRLIVNAEIGRKDAMAAYMKYRFPFLGVNATKRKEILKLWRSQLPELTEQEERSLIQELWEFPEREMHYCAIDLLVTIPANKLKQEDAELIEQLIISNSWWDSVDTIASNVVGKYFLRFRGERDRLINKWKISNNIWLKRSCLIFQLKYGKETDFILLCSLIRDFAPIKEFFIQKAIGWALRQYAKTDPERVKNFLREIELKGVALKEATKYI